MHTCTHTRHLCTITHTQSHALFLSPQRSTRSRARADGVLEGARAEAHAKREGKGNDEREREASKAAVVAHVSALVVARLQSRSPLGLSLSLSLSPQRVRFRAPLPPSLFEAQAHVLLLMPAHK